MKKTKKEIVKLLLDQDLEVDDEEQLIEMLVEDPISVDVYNDNDEKLTTGEKLADKLTKRAGSWGFIIIFVLFIIAWIVLNIAMFKNLDPYPFILLNLVLSCVAAVQAPIIMMSQNRASKKDSLRSHNDYKTDLKSELILEELHHKMADILATQKKILKKLEENDDKTKADV